MTPQEEQDVARLKEACNTLIEHFDSVQIFATRHESGELDGTVNVAFGAGNWFARFGQVKTWLTKQDEGTRIILRSDML